jgi:hypothetical protein
MQFAWDQAAPGVTAAFRTMLSNPYQQGAQGQVQAESALAKVLWGIEQDKAQTAAAQALAARTGAEADILARRPDLLSQMGANETGMSVPSFNEAVQRRQSGLPAVVFDSGAQTMIDPKADTKIAQALTQLLPLAGVKDWNPDQIAKARGEYKGQSRVDDMIQGTLDPARVQAAQFAEKGSPRHGVQGDMVVDQLKGVLMPTPIGESRITENKAQAASADARSKGADKFQLIPMPDAQGNMTLQRVPVQGEAGPVPLPAGVAPAPRRDAASQDTRGDHARDWPDQYAQNMPSVEEYRQIRAAGMSGKTPVLEAKPGAKSYEVGKVYRTPRGLMIRREGGWEPVGGAAAK